MISEFGIVRQIKCELQGSEDYKPNSKPMIVQITGLLVIFLELGTTARRASRHRPCRSARSSTACPCLGHLSYKDRIANGNRSSGRNRDSCHLEGGQGQRGKPRQRDRRSQQEHLAIRILHRTFLNVMVNYINSIRSRCHRQNFVKRASVLAYF